MKFDLLNVLYLFTIRYIRVYIFQILVSSNIELTSNFEMSFGAAKLISFRIHLF